METQRTADGRTAPHLFLFCRSNTKEEEHLSLFLANVISIAVVLKAPATAFMLVKKSCSTKSTGHPVVSIFISHHQPISYHHWHLTGQIVAGFSKDIYPTLTFQWVCHIKRSSSRVSFLLLPTYMLLLTQKAPEKTSPTVVWQSCELQGWSLNSAIFLDQCWGFAVLLFQFLMCLLA